VVQDEGHEFKLQYHKKIIKTFIVILFTNVKLEATECPLTGGQTGVSTLKYKSATGVPLTGAHRGGWNATPPGDKQRGGEKFF
jgi:hypothetical protein